MRTAKHMKEVLETFKIGVNDAHAELVMNMDPGSGEAFQAKTELLRLTGDMQQQKIMIMLFI